jgi:hypothetical protein
MVSLNLLQNFLAVAVAVAVAVVTTFEDRESKRGVASYCFTAHTVKHSNLVRT